MSESINGVPISVSPSPYDVPEAVRSVYDESKRRFSIEFQYIGEEPLKSSDVDRGVRCLLGKNSGRLYGIDVYLDKAALEDNSAASILKVIVPSIDALASGGGREVRKRNYGFASQAVDNEKDSLFAVLESPASASA
jgi:hypothetical protein